MLGTCNAKWAGQPPPTNAQRTVRRASFNFRSRFLDHSADVESCLAPSSKGCAARVSTFVLDDELRFTLFVGIVLGTCYAKWAGQPPPTDAQRTVRRASLSFRSRFVDHSADVESCSRFLSLSEETGIRLELRRHTSVTPVVSRRLLREPLAPSRNASGGGFDGTVFVCAARQVTCILALLFE